MNARVDEHTWTPGIVLAVVGVVLIQIGRALRAVDDNLADFPE